MADDIFGASRRRNVSPKSSTLHVQTRDVDCSALALPPEDGEFILLSGARPTADAVFTGAADNAITATDVEGSQLRMVWSSAKRSDRAALGDKRVPVFMHGPGIDLDVKLYNCDDGADGLASAYPVGTLLSVAQGPAAKTLPNVPNDTAETRFLLCPAGATGWVVGYVRESAAGTAGDDKAIKIHLYGTPRYHGSSD